MRNLKVCFITFTFALGFLAVAAPGRAQDNLLITEFMAENERTIEDEDGDDSDWIEIYNAGTNAVNLLNWGLRDSDTTWLFPATNIAPGQIMLIFASNKNRRTPGAPLHTNFRLDNDGEYLALLRTNGSIAFQYFLPVPQQAPDVSYGIPLQELPRILMLTGAAAKVFVPADGSLGATWTATDFNASSWSNAVTGVGYETDPTTPAVVGDSAADFSGTQGSNNWFYGYYNRSADTAAGYQSSNFVVFPAHYWTGVQWDWPNGNPPWDEIGRTNCHPNGINSGGEHWVIRRWVSKVSGTITVDWFLAKSNPSGLGVTGRIFHNDTQRDSVAIASNNTNGTNRAVTIINVQVGDTIDIALDPTGPTGDAGDSGDGSYMSAVIRGVGNLSGQISTSIEGMMRDRNATAYIRIPFVVTNAASLSVLTLRMKYDDGFSAYLNGLPLVSRNAPETLDWSSSAPAARQDTDALQFEDIDTSPIASTLMEGTNVLAIHGLNVSFEDSDFLILPEVRGASVTLNVAAKRYFSIPTPGAVNGLGQTNLGPIIVDVEHTPNEPLDTEDITVLVRVAPALAPIGSVTLRYRLMFGPTNNVVMLDDGMSGDGGPGDGLYAGKIPSSLSTTGQMVRWFITATDAQGRSSRFPAFASPINSPEFLGTMVHVPQTNKLPIMNLFLTNLGAANTRAGTRCSLFYLGRFYDNLAINLHGQSSGGFAVDKKSYDIDFHPGHHFTWTEGEPDVDDINLLTTYSDKAKMRNILPYETYRAASGTYRFGAAGQASLEALPTAYHYTVPIRVHTNGGFFAIYDLVENGDDNFLERIGRDPSGALYKLYNTFTVIANTTIGTDPFAEKKTRRNEGNQDLVDLFNGMANSATPVSVRTNYMYDNINLPATIDFLAARVITGDVDCCHKNYYFYRDTDGTGEWEGMPWDVDLSFGRNWNSTEAYFDNAMFPNNGLGVGGNNGVFGLIIGATFQPTRQMYLRRIRTLMDSLLQPTNTPPALGKYENRIDEMFVAIDPDNQLDLAKWGTWRDFTTGGMVPNGAPTFDTNHVDYETLSESVARLKQYLIDRRISMYNRVNTGELPAAQPANAMILFGTIEFNPNSANQAEEYFQLRNTNTYAVDISGWTISGAVDYTFRGGCVIPANTVLYVSPDVKAFRSRTVSPRGGEGRFVQGNYRGQLSARGESLVLTDDRGRVLGTNTYPGNASLPQLSLRITEIMYRPAVAPAGSPYSTEDFEFIELKNVGVSPMSLIGVHFANGIDFMFTTNSAVTNLLSGQSVLLVKNIAAFTSRYGSGFAIAGAYGGNLENRGEQIELLDASNEKILDFEYNNSWYPSTDGLGFSLVIVDENAPFNTWDQKESWRPSGRDGGSAGQSDPPQITVAPILVNEVLTHTDLPLVDYIELYNPNTNDVNIGGWFLSDDFVNTRKYRIPNPTVIPAGGYRVFDETHFNTPTNLPTSFSFSSKGDEAYLFSGDGTNLTGFFHGYEFAAAENGVSFGRYYTSTGAVHFVAQSARTPMATNAPPKVGPIVITEIMYHPPDYPNEVDNQDHEYIELHNLSNTNVTLFSGGNPWHLRGSVEFDFPASTIIGPSNYLLVVSFHPLDKARASSFRTTYSLSTNVPLYGPYVGKLDNSSESVRLYRPETPEAEEIPYVLIDQVDYSDSTPWPAIADGTGLSLQRIQRSQYGNDAINWTSVGPTPASPYPGGMPPTITMQPEDETGVVGLNATFSVEASGPPPLNYQWYFSGSLIFGATGSSLVVSNAQPSDVGDYFVIVFNGGGYAQSSNANLTVLFPAFIFQQPTNVVLRGTNGAANFGHTFANAVFSVGANSSSSLSYQWRLNGEDIPGATSSSLIVSNATLANEGAYDVLVTDDVATIPSAPATLSIWVNPFITQQPLGLTLAAGSNVTFSVTARGHPLPFGYRWRRNGILYTFVSTNSTNATLTLNNVSNLNAGAWTVVVTNQANITGAISTNATLTVVTPPTNQVVPVGGTATFAVFATNTPGSFPRYQWRFNNADISGATTNNYSVTNVQPSDVGAYSVVVTATNLPALPPASFSALLSLLVTGPLLSNPEVLVNGSFRAQLEGTLNQMYAIESSQDLTNWAVLTNLTFSGSPAYFVDPGRTNAAGATNRFYRARETQ